MMMEGSQEAAAVDADPNRRLAGINWLSTLTPAASSRSGKATSTSTVGGKARYDKEEIFELSRVGFSRPTRNTLRSVQSFQKVDQFVLTGDGFG